MENITHNAEKKINEGASKLQEGLERARRNALDVTEQALPKGDRFLETAKSESAKLWNKTVANIEKSPIKALGIAVVVGIVLGAFTFSRRKN